MSIRGSLTTLFRTLIAGALALALLSGRTAGAVELKVADDYWAKLNFLTQPWLQLTNDPTAATDLSSDFYVRRTRLILQGQVSKWVSFFFETDTPNWGKGAGAASWTPTLFVQDVFVTFDAGEEFKVDVGMILPPFIHMARQGAINLHTLDYHADLIKFPAEAQKGWRDMGVEVRGLLFDKKLDYRFFVGDGAATPDDIPRFTGRLAYNVFDAEEGFFLGGTYLGTKRVLSIGVAFDVQPDIVAGGETYYAFGGDVFWDLPMNDGDRLSGQLDFVYYRGLPGTDAAGNAILADTTGMGLLFDVGYAFGPWEPLIAVDWFRPEGAEELKDMFLGLHVGVNWWFLGHGANLKFDAALVKDANEEFGDAARVFTVQTQVFF